MSELMRVFRQLFDRIGIDVNEMENYTKFIDFDEMPRNQGFKIKDMSPRHSKTITVAKKEPFKRLNRRMGRM